MKVVSEGRLIHHCLLRCPCNLDTHTRNLSTLENKSSLPKICNSILYAPGQFNPDIIITKVTLSELTAPEYRDTSKGNSPLAKEYGSRCEGSRRYCSQKGSGFNGPHPCTALITILDRMHHFEKSMIKMTNLLKNMLYNQQHTQNDTTKTLVVYHTTYDIPTFDWTPNRYFEWILKL